MKMYRVLIIMGLFVSYGLIDAAVFKIINRTAGGVKNPAGSKIKVKPLWNGSGNGFVELNPGEETGGYDSGFNNLTGLIYEEMIPQSDDQKKNAIFCTRRYKVDFNISGWAVGGKIYVQSDADVSYAFDTIAGSGTAKAQPYSD